MNINSVNLAGHLGKDPELKYVGAKGTPLCNASVATTWGKKDDPKRETSWHRLEAWGERAEQLAMYEKGQAVSIKGRIKYSEKDGKYYTSIVVSEILEVEPYKPKSGFTKED